MNWKRLARLARPEAKLIAWGTLSLAVASATGLAYPQVLRKIIDEALGGRDPATIDRAALTMAGLFLVQGFAIALRYFCFATAGERAVARLRAELFRSLMSQEVAFFDAQRTGDLTSRLGSDTTVLQSAVSTNISMGLRNTAAVVGGVALLFYTSPTLAVLMLAIVPPVALGAMAYGRRVRKLSREVQDALARANEVAEEALSGIRTVRSFAAEKVEARRYTEAVGDSFVLARKRILAASTFMGAASSAAYGSGALVFWYGGRLVGRGELSVGSLTSFLVYTLLVAFSLGALSDLWAEFNRASGAAEKIFELLDRVPLIPSTGGAPLANPVGKVCLEGVSFSYPSRPDVPVLRNLSLTINPGEVVALVGPSGAGKSTVAALLYRLYDPASGHLTFDGQDLKELDPDSLRRQIGVVAQEPLLFSTSVLENIRYGREGATQEEVEAAARSANAWDFIRAFPEGFGTRVGERGVQLSGGQKQRVAIARALLKDPRLLILDEATSALDAQSEHLVEEALERLMKGRSSLVIAHRLSTVLRADRVLVLDQGRVVQSGTHSALMSTEGLYRRLVERQFVSA